MAEIFQLYYEVPVFYTTFVCTVFINLGHFYGENCYTTVLLLCFIFKLEQYIYFYIIKGDRNLQTYQNGGAEQPRHSGPGGGRATVLHT